MDVSQSQIVSLPGAVITRLQAKCRAHLTGCSFTLNRDIREVQNKICSTKSKIGIKFRPSAAFLYTIQKWLLFHSTNVDRMRKINSL